MSLAALIRDVVDMAMEALDDVPFSVTLQSQADQTFTPSTGAVTENRTNYTGTGVWGTIKSHEIDGTHVTTSSRKLLISDLTSGTSVNEGDRVVAQSVTYAINIVKSDPTGDALHVCFVRPL